MKQYLKPVVSLAVAALTLTPSATAREILRIGCVGNSITYGYGTPDPATDSYPAQLSRMLPADRYEVRNFGRSRATLLENGHFPYVHQPEYQASLDYRPDIVVIHLGINDTDPRNWPAFGDEFVTDYVRLIQSFRDVNPQVRIIIANISPIAATHHRFKSGTRIWRDTVRDAVSRVAQITGAELIDFETPLLNHQDLLSDGIHPTTEGLGLLAQTVRSAITGDYGGLSLSPVYTDGMVLQRNRKININGTADTGSIVTVTFGDITVKSTADNLGNWNVTLPPMEASSTGRTLSVSDTHSNLSFDDVVVGELWIASGQSNMRFTVAEEMNSALTVASSSDSLLRFYNMEPRYRPNSKRWDDADLDSVNHLHYFAPTHWVKSSPQTVRPMSAIAYHFGRELRDSLQVPVGIINNSVGGAPAESYIHMDILQHGMPEVLLNWRNNDYLQPWVQKRAYENAPADNNPRQRHPYEPTYLYAAGITPIEGLTAAGVLWYQGESNAHNTQIHEGLFPLVVQSWRKALDDDLLPIYTVQLSGISRPGWAEFRDSQRRMALDMENVTMAVSFDLGDSIDVHPNIKAPIGHRLAAAALNRQYGFTAVEYSGPEPLAAIAVDSTVVLTMTHADGLTTRDGTAPRTFEIAEYEGYYFPATAIINGNTIRMTAPGVKHPRMLRYAWKPYVPEANLTNSSNIPASTFKMKVTKNNAPVVTITEIDGTPSDEKGIDKGISAPYAGSIGGSVAIVAGGCNFPEKDPLAPSAIKKTYQGIYALPTGSDRWNKIGQLPEAAAYGASLPGKDALVVAGGIAGGKPIAKVYEITITTAGKAAIKELANMPVTIDNPGFASDGMTGYVVGGNCDGTPSQRVFAYDFNSDTWKELPPMPGNPRVQPTAAVSSGKLYVWGGFAGKNDGRDASLECTGLMFDPASGLWTSLGAPTLTDGTEVSLGGGTAATLADGRIVATGGVNKDIFLSALRNQPTDYLMHDPEWYRFNGNVFVFDPESMMWSIGTQSPLCARAGAMLIPIDADSLMLFGGELKPRIRTPRVIKLTIF